jgi:Beta-galactosidase
MKHIFLFLFAVASFNSYAQIKNYMFIGMDREQLKKTKLWVSNGIFEGVQVAYPWKQLEPEKDKYDFERITEDLKLLQKYGKKLFIHSGCFILPNLY